MIAEEGLFLGRDFFPWMMIALGAALVVGNVAALLRPPPAASGGSEGGPTKAPVGRAVMMIVVGAVVTGWGIASLG